MQGVGFRPHVHRLATDLGLAGFVLNDAAGVVVEVEADPAAVERFLERLGAEAPALARIERVLPEELPAVGDRGFAILRERRRGGRLRRRPRRRRHLRRLPRASSATPPTAGTATRSSTAPPAAPATRSSPASPTTAPAPPWPRFAMCDACRAEYEDPADRRFHAEPIACHELRPPAEPAAARTWWRRSSTAGSRR